jgi:hypothetical protein
MINRRRRLLLALPLLAACHAMPANASRNLKMDKTGWKTHCFGRYLVDLPPDARVTAKYKIWDDEIVWLKGYMPDMLKAEIDKREAELKAQKHKTKGSMFVQRAAHPNGSTTLVSWSEPYYDKMYLGETYFVVPHPYRVYRYNGDISVNRLAIALANNDRVSNALHARADNEIPTEPGFCINGGYIAGSEFMDEEFSVSLGFPRHPDVSFGISGYVVGEPDKPLLERTDSAVAGFLGKFAGLSVLRKRKRPVGPIEAEEFLIAGREKGQTTYAFKWEAPGKAKSLALPNLNVELGLLEQTPPPPTPPFKDDDEALQLWDAIVDSIRLRPGAV